MLCYTSQTNERQAKSVKPTTMRGLGLRSDVFIDPNGTTQSKQPATSKSISQKQPIFTDYRSALEEQTKLFSDHKESLAQQYANVTKLHLPETKQERLELFKFVCASANVKPDS